MLRRRSMLCIVLTVLWCTVVVLGVRAFRLWDARDPNRQDEGAVGQKRANNRASAPIAVAVYLQETHFGSSGTKPGTRQIQAVRGDGASLTLIEHAKPNGVVTLQRFLVLPGGDEIVVDDVRELKMTVPGAGHWEQRLRDPKTDCLNSFSGVRMNAGEVVTGHDTIAGYRTARVVDARGMTTWLAPELGCALLQLRVSVSPGTHNVLSATRVVKGEADAGLFNVPARFREVTYADMYRRAR